MPEFYVDPNGNYVNVGSSLLPVKDLNRAIDAASDGDTIYVQNTTELNPIRLPSFCAKSLTIRPAPGESVFYHSGCQNVSHGAVYESTAQRAVFHTSINVFSAGAGAAYQAGVKLYGAGSAELVGAGTWIRQTIPYKGRKIRHRIVYKTTAGGTAQVRMDLGGGLYWQFGDTPPAAGASTANYDLPAATEWTEWVSDWIDTSASPTWSGYFYIFQKTAAQSTYVQEYHMEVESVWSDQGNSTWAMPFVVGAGVWANGTTIPGRSPRTTVSKLFKGSGWANWRNVETTGSAPVTEGFSYLDTTNSKLIYLPVAGETVTALHFEKLFGNGTMQFTAGTSVIYNPINIGNDHSLYISGNANVKAYNPIERCSGEGGFKAFGTSTVELFNPITEQPVESSGVKEYGGGFISGYGNGTSTNSMTIHGATAINVGDDALQPTDAATMIVNGMTAIHTYGNAIEASFNHATLAGTLRVRNFSSYGGAAYAFMDQTTDGSAGANTIELTNCALYSDQANNIVVNTAGGETNTYTIDNVFTTAIGYSGTATGVPAALTAGVTILATPPYTDAANGDLTPTAGSAFQGTGTKWWTTGPRPAGADGAPFPDWDLDVGGIQSNHSTWCPQNV